MSEWWERKTPNEIIVAPWLSQEATDYLESILRADFDVLEHGGGGSTLWFAERVSHVHTIENDPDWRGILKSKAPGNVLFVNVPSGQYDIFMIDGDPVEDRATWLRQAREIVRPGGWIVLDNANRPEYVKERDALTEFCELVNRVDGNIRNNRVASKYFVTEFWKVKDAHREQPKQSRRRPR